MENLAEHAGLFCLQKVEWIGGSQTFSALYVMDINLPCVSVTY